MEPLKLLINEKTGHAIIGRKKSVFEKYGEEGALFIGRVFEEENNLPVFLDSLSPHVVFVCGARGSGKSYILGVIAEELAKKNKEVATIVIDPVGVFWSMKEPNKDEVELKLLKEWGLFPEGVKNLRVLIPEGMKRKIPKETYDGTFAIKPSMLDADDWVLTFGIDRFSPTGLLLERVLKLVKTGYKTIDGEEIKGRKNYSLDDIIFCLENAEEIHSKGKGFKKDSVRALLSRFEAAKHWGIFSKEGTPLGEIAVKGMLTIIDVSFLEENVAALFIGILARRILSARKLATRKETSKSLNIEDIDDLLEIDIPPTWLFVDEAHTLIPAGTKTTAATKALIEYVKQGRRPGCSLVFATQQPSAIDSRVLSQVDLLFSFKLVFDDDIKAVFKRMPAIIPKEYKDPAFIKRLEIGTALVADRADTTSRAFVIKIRPRQSQHEGREVQTAELKEGININNPEEWFSSLIISKITSQGFIEKKVVFKLVEKLRSRYLVNLDFEKVKEFLRKEGIKENKELFYVGTFAKKEKELFFKETIDEKKANELAKSFLKKGFFSRPPSFSLSFSYFPVFEVVYKDKDGKVRKAYVDGKKLEFIHYKGKLLWSKGLSKLLGKTKDEIKLFLLANKKNEKELMLFSRQKTKRILGKLLEDELLKVKIKNRDKFYYWNALLPSYKERLLSSLEVLERTKGKKEIVKDVFPNASKQVIRKTLKYLWDVEIEKVEILYFPYWRVTSDKEDFSFDAITGTRL